MTVAFSHSLIVCQCSKRKKADDKFLVGKSKVKERGRRRKTVTIICLILIQLEGKWTWDAQRKHYKLLRVPLIPNSRFLSLTRLSQTKRITDKESCLHYAHMRSHMESSRTKDTPTSTQGVESKPKVINTCCHWKKVQNSLFLCPHTCLISWCDAWVLQL